MRLFIAIDLDNKEYFKEIQDKIDSENAKIKPVLAFHLTLKFLGEVDESKTNEIKDILNKIEFESFSVKTTKIGVFPDMNFIRVVWVGLGPEDKIIELQKKVDEGLKDMFNVEKDFKPHLTLARVKFIKDKEKFVDSLKKIKVDPKEFKVDKIKLIKSILTPEGPVYEEIK